MRIIRTSFLYHVCANIFPFPGGRKEKSVLKEENLQVDYGGVLMLQLIVIFYQKRKPDLQVIEGHPSFVTLFRHCS